jgi:excisionase family DNA binding protein
LTELDWHGTIPLTYRKGVTTVQEKNELLTVKEAATMLHTTPQTIRRWAKERFINAVRLKKEYRIKLDSLFKSMLGGENFPAK